MSPPTRPGLGARPPWWPENEAWPPAHSGPWRRSGGWDGRGRGPWGRGRPSTAVRIGCGLVFVAVFAAVVVAAVAWAWAGLSGAGSGPGVVVGLAVLALLLGAVVLVLRWIRRLAEPVDDLVAAARQVEAGDYDVQVPERGPREARSLARAFNRMGARLSATEQERRSFLADLTHELRTPLAVVRGNAEAIADGIYPADAEHLAPILDATTTLERLVDDLRTVAQAEAGDLELRLEPVDLGSLLADTAAGLATEASARQVTVAIDAADDLPTLEADPVRLAQVFTNLLANALRHAPAGSAVALIAGGGAASGWVRIDVRDDGPGFPPDLLAHAFDRFARGDDSPGAGLGLAIARDLVVAHGGRIEARNRAEGGAEVTVHLPIQPDVGRLAES